MKCTGSASWLLWHCARGDRPPRVNCGNSPGSGFGTSKVPTPVSFLPPLPTDGTAGGIPAAAACGPHGARPLFLSPRPAQGTDGQVAAPRLEGPGAEGVIRLRRPRLRLFGPLEGSVWAKHVLLRSHRDLKFTCFPRFSLTHSILTGSPVFKVVPMEDSSPHLYLYALCNTISFRGIQRQTC